MLKLLEEHFTIAYLGCCNPKNHFLYLRATTWKSAIALTIELAINLFIELYNQHMIFRSVNLFSVYRY